MSLDDFRHLLNRGTGRIEGELHLAICPAAPRCNHARVLPSTTLLLHLSDGRRAVIHHDLHCDGASIPSPMRVKYGDSLSSCNAHCGVPHDDWYRTATILVLERDPSDPTKSLVVPTPIDKATADLYLFDLARAAGHSDKDALEIYEGVHLGGASAWEENARKRAACGDISVPESLARLLAWVGVAE